MTKSTATATVLGARALNRATLERQLLLRRSPLSVKSAVGHLLGLQAQNVKPPYYALAARLDGFTPEALSRLMADREVVRIVTMRSTIHTHTAADALTLRPLVQPARDRELTNFRKGLEGVDLDRLAALARDLVEAEPRTMKQLREALQTEWPDADAQSLGIAARCKLPLVQVTPRGLWGRSGQVALTTAEHWLGRGSATRSAPPAAAAPGAASPTATAPGTASATAPAQGAASSAVTVSAADSSAVTAPASPVTAPASYTPPVEAAPSSDATVLRYLAAFGPASVKDMQTWAGLTRLRDAFERLRPQLVTFRDENGVELFDLPEAPRPDADTPAPPRFLPEFDNLLLSHADRTRVVPPEHRGRSWVGNQAHCTVLVDGFLAGVWKLAEGALVIEPFGRLTKARRADVVDEGMRMLDTMHPGSAYDIRFGTVIP
ncbi:winged helix DNA-binding domain-containing protein [Streptomyces guryensis]|uniref:Winged helix DNA-binding domain-containing protein n=1 Tax=Streptomyces guryensis TaxID=2886947 RepID=A0A9Q3VIP3_9ACTN|nr:winged helix DNA-binding domain-containing protein [Streptomyces guryensis]MCD9873249.1 winged helix DNA-binding domain-containing protein [Streptomyces guryensis]